MSSWGEVSSDLDETWRNSSCKRPEASYSAQGPQKQPEIITHLLFRHYKEYGNNRRIPYIVPEKKGLCNPLIRFRKNFVYIWIIVDQLGGFQTFPVDYYPVFHEESESEVQHAQILQEILKTSISIFQSFYFNPISGLIPIRALL